MKITKKELLSALSNTRLVGDTDLIEAIITQPNCVEVRFTVVEEGTGFTAPKVVKFEKEDLDFTPPSQIEIDEKGTKNLQ
jgi:hypothetical protein